MEGQASHKSEWDLLDQKLTELALLAMKLSPKAGVEVTTRRYEDEDGRLKVFPPPGVSEAEEEKLEEALTERCVEILEQTQLFILCAVFDAQA